jgi:hypothetical protein
MRKVSIQIVALAFSLLFVACDSNVQGEFKNELTGPSGAVALVSFTPATILLSPIGSLACPFVTPFNLVVDGRATGDLFLEAVSFRFIDGSSIGRTPLISWFTTPELNTRFGQTLIVGGTTRSFAFAPQFGCDQIVPQSVTADVTLHDRRGTPQQMSVTSTVR